MFLIGIILWKNDRATNKVEPWRNLVEPTFAPEYPVLNQPMTNQRPTIDQATL